MKANPIVDYVFIGIIGLLAFMQYNPEALNGIKIPDFDLTSQSTTKSPELAGILSALADRIEADGQSPDPELMTTTDIQLLKARALIVANVHAPVGFAESISPVLTAALPQDTPLTPELRLKACTIFREFSKKCL